MEARQVIEDVYDCIVEQLGKTRDVISIYGCDNDNWVAHFQIKGAERWLFGIWVTDIEHGFAPIEERKPVYRVNLFGQALRGMDKFKPNCSPIAYSFEIPKDRRSLYIPDGMYRWWLDEVEKFAMDVHKVYISHLGAMIKYYWEPEYGTPAKWLVGRWWKYCIKNPFRERFSLPMVHFCLRCRKVLHWAFLWPWLDEVVLIDNTRDGHTHYPNFEFIDVTKPRLSESTLCRLYHLTTPLHGFHRVDYAITVKDERRPFWYPSGIWEEFRKVRERCVYDVNGVNNLTLWQKLKRRLEYVVKYPGFWVMWKLGK